MDVLFLCCKFSLKIRFMLCFSVLTSTTATSSACQPSPYVLACPARYRNTDGKYCFGNVIDRSNASTAQALCHKYQGEVLYLYSDEDYEAALGSKGYGDKHWLALRTRKGRLVWDRDNREIFPESYHGFEHFPNTDELQKPQCVDVDMSVNSWELVSCSEERNVLCRTPTATEPSEPMFYFPQNNGSQGEPELKEMMVGETLTVACSAIGASGQLHVLLLSEDEEVISIINSSDPRTYERNETVQRGENCVYKYHLVVNLEMSLAFNGDVILCSSDYNSSDALKNCSLDDRLCAVLGTLSVKRAPQTPRQGQGAINWLLVLTIVAAGCTALLASLMLVVIVGFCRICHKERKRSLNSKDATDSNTLPVQ